ncbi:hypothetical protein [Spongiactinospora rosea]|uniref:hypothetical protein n=1 Tax=Spongiactinospora rosea TaxID=2248750 RepID=UPI0011C07661|nr:hypothetical protein [Spongiactinospora rosea]
MRTGQPPTSELHEHCRQLHSSHLWLDVAMCWTVVVPDSGRAFSLDQIAARLGGDTPHQLHEPALPRTVMLPYDTGYPVLVDWCGPATMLLEQDYLGSTPEVASSDVIPASRSRYPARRMICNRKQAHMPT